MSRQVDVNNTFLNGESTKKVYMPPYSGFKTVISMICMLKKALFGLKQAQHVWFQKLSYALIIILLYVDNILFIGSDPYEVTSIIYMLHIWFTLKDLGELSYFLDIKITCISNRLDILIGYIEVVWIDPNLLLLLWLLVL